MAGLALSGNTAGISARLTILSFVDYLGVSLVAPQIGMRIRETGASHTITGLIASSYGAIQLLSSTPHGVCCDKFGRRNTMIISSFILAVLYLALARARSFLFLLVVRSALGMFKHTQSNMKIIGGDIFGTGVERTQFISTINSMSGFAFMIGPLITAELPKESCFYLSSTICGLCFLAISNVTFWHIPETLKKTPNPRTSEEREGTVDILHQSAADTATPPAAPPTTFLQRLNKYKKLRVVFLFRFFAALSVVIVRYFIPLFTMHYMGFNIRNNSHMTSFVGFTGVVCASLAGYISQWVPDKRKLTLYSSILLCFAIASSLLGTKIQYLVFTQFTLSLATQNLRVVIDSIILSSVDDGDRGEVYGVGATVVSMCRVGGPILAGALGDIHMMAPLLCSLGFAVLATVVWWVGATPDKDIKTE